MGTIRWDAWRRIELPSCNGSEEAPYTCLVGCFDMDRPETCPVEPHRRWNAPSGSYSHNGSPSWGELYRPLRMKRTCHTGAYLKLTPC
jgi:hypothetical protein